MKILVTGITGFLGKEFLKRIIQDVENEYVLLVRDSSVHKLDSLIGEFNHIEIAIGSLTNSLLFKNQSDFESYSKEIEKIVHLAALYDLGADSDRLYLANVVGTQNILYFCAQCSLLKELDYASTIAVAGNWSGYFSEDDFNLGQGFDNAYSKTKYNAEELIRNYSRENDQLVVRVIRFGVIVGHSETGEIPKNDGPYYFFSNISKLFQMAPVLKKLSFVPFPFKKDAIFPLVPVDTAANLLMKKALRGHGLETIHCLSADLPTMGEFLQDFLNSINVSFSVIPIPRNRFIAQVLPKFNIPEALVEYLYMPTKYECKRIENYLPDRPTYRELRKPLFNFVKGQVIEKDEP